MAPGSGRPAQPAVPPQPVRDESALKVNTRVIGALVIREMLTRFGRNNLGFLWLVLEPAAFVLVVTWIWTATRQIHMSNFPIASFTLAGYSAALLWRYTAGRGLNAIAANKPLLYHRQVKMLDVYLARIILELVGVTTAFVLLGTGLYAIGWIELPEDPLTMLVGWTMLSWFAAGLALTVGAASERAPLVAKLWAPVSLIMFLFSGAAYTVDALPERAREIALLIPMVHGTECIRDGFFGSKFVAHYDLFYLGCWNFGLTLLGLSLVRRLRFDEAEGE